MLGILAFGLAVVTAPRSAVADGLEFGAHLTGAQEVPAVITDATGEISVSFNAGLSAVRVELEIDGLAADNQADAAHFHCARPGVNGPIALGLVAKGPCDGADLASGELECRLTNADFGRNDCDEAIGRPVNNIASLAFAMRDGLIYANVHTPTNFDGEIRGQLLPEDDDDD